MINCRTAGAPQFIATKRQPREAEMHNKDSRPRARDRSVLEENLLCGEGPSRREVLKTGTAIAVSAGGAQLLACDAAAQGQDRDAAALEQLRRANGDPRRRVLLRGGTIISMDTTVGDFAHADLLIEGKKYRPLAQIWMRWRKAVTLSSSMRVTRY
jgi:hypothetical protein